MPGLPTFAEFEWPDQIKSEDEDDDDDDDEDDEDDEDEDDFRNQTQARVNRAFSGLRI